MHTAQPAQTPADDVRVDGSTLAIARLRTTDPAVVAAARAHVDSHGERADLAGFARSALSIGSRALGLASGSLDGDTLALRLDAFGDRVAASAARAEARIGETVAWAAHPETGAVAVAVTASLARLELEVARLVEGEDAPVRTAVRQGLREATRRGADDVARALAAQTEAVRAALATDDPASPWSSLQRDVRAAAEETRRDLGGRLDVLRGLAESERARAAVVEGTSLKGRPHEEAVLAAVEAVAAGLTDALEPTGSTVGLVPNAKTGDAVVTLAAAAAHGQEVRVVVEAKDSRLSPERWRKELDAARRNRGAVAAIGVVRRARDMPGGRLVHVVDPLGVVVAHEPGEQAPDLLAAVYHLVRAAALGRAASDAGHEADARHLAAVVRDALDGLAGFERLHKATGLARLHLEQVAAQADLLHADVRTRLMRGVPAAGPAAPAVPEAA